MYHASKHLRCFVLGGTGHVGAAVCRNLSHQAMKVAYTYFSNADKARALQAELSDCMPVYADLSDYDATRRVVQTAAQWLGGLDVLIQCAATAGDPMLYQRCRTRAHGKLLGITQAEWDGMLNLTVRSTFAACQQASEIMALQQTGGNIVIVGSIDGVRALPAPIHYAASKGAIRSLVEALAKELGEDDIRVNYVAAGILDGGLSHYLDADLRQAYLDHCALKRVGTAEEVAEVVTQLAIDNTYITGQTLVLDGGL